MKGYASINVRLVVVCNLKYSISVKLIVVYDFQIIFVFNTHLLAAKARLQMSYCMEMEIDGFAKNN